MKESTLETILTIFFAIMIIIVLSLSYYPVKCWMHDGSYPSSALPYVYERMSDKINVTFIY